MAKAKKAASQSPIEAVVVPLAASTTFLAAIMNEIDEADDITETIKHRFTTDQLIQKESVDQTIVMRDQLEGMKQRAKEVSRRWEEQFRKIERLQAAIDGRIMDVMKENQGVPFKGTIGELVIRKNPPSLKTSFGGTTIDKGTIEMFGIAPEFYEEVPPPPPPPPSYKLKTNDVKKLIAEHGEENEHRKTCSLVPWAWTEQGERLDVK